MFDQKASLNVRPFFKTRQIFPKIFENSDDRSLKAQELNLRILGEERIGHPHKGKATH